MANVDRRTPCRMHKESNMTAERGAITVACHVMRTSLPPVRKQVIRQILGPIVLICFLTTCLRKGVQALGRNLRISCGNVRRVARTEKRSGHDKGRHQFSSSEVFNQRGVLSVVDVFDLNARRWTERIPCRPVCRRHTWESPAARSVSSIRPAANWGHHCSPAVADCCVLAFEPGSGALCQLCPTPRYGTPCACGGEGCTPSRDQNDRCTPACIIEHRRRRGKALEKQWRKKCPFRGRPHRASVLCKDRLYVFGDGRRSRTHTGRSSLHL